MKGAREAGAHTRGHALGVRDCKAVSGSREAIFGNRAPPTETLRPPNGLLTFRKVPRGGHATEYSYTFCS